ncbi:type 1 glutamine amidotransferase [Belnapia sp. T6]|uniref:Type 1 glutamine amidotransferase n=1 Tax=Belnapia mucosa TaxID=2804532 RepID=A0ABS1UWU3_9PROT|nr:type 1 glutamine amidotransferase [Belnapia mucosa]MBL6453941.1 type 1 glutamine amidotransferase [Belnapia mucosa]
MTPRILIADCTPAAATAELMVFGGPSNIAMFQAALRLHEPGLDCLAFNLADGEALPQSATLGDFSGLVLTGSPLHIPGGGPAVMRQVEFTRAAFASGIPVWGSCWGLQLAAAALGGTVRSNPRGREIGIARGITRTESGRAHPLLEGRPPVFEAICSHMDEVETPPPCAEVLAWNAVSGVQAMALHLPGGGTFHGTQYHPEMTLGCIAALVTLRADVLVAEGFAESEAAMAAHAADLRALEAAPERRDLAWRTGIGPEVLDRRRHTVELGNWLRDVVLPRSRRA